MAMDPVLAIRPPGPGEWLIILAIVVLLFGGAKIPELARSLGKAKAEFQKGVEQGEEEVASSGSSKSQAEDAEDEEPTTNDAATV